MRLNFGNRLNHVWLHLLNKFEAYKNLQKEGEWLCAGTYHDKVLLFYKSRRNGKDIPSFLISQDGLNFSILKENVVIPIQNYLKSDRSTSFRLSYVDGNYYLSFSKFLAKSKDLEKFTVQNFEEFADEPVNFISDYKHNGNYVLIFGKNSIKLALSKDLKSWYKSSPLAQPRGGFFDNSPLTVVGAYRTLAGLLVVYDCSTKLNNHPLIQCGALLLSNSQPDRVIWRSEVPLFDPHLENEGSEISPLGSAIVGDKLMLYWGAKNQDLLMISIPFNFLENRSPVLLTKFSGNPIITPQEENDWESIGTFNPAAIYGNGKVHLVYRAVGKNGVSTLGYASSKNGFDIDLRLPDPIYFPREEFEGAMAKAANYCEFAVSGGSWGGCEDPKLTEIEDKIYMTYVAHNGYNLPRIALTSINKKDFYSRNWVWSKPVLISAPGVIDKSGCILPEKVNGKFVIFHRVFPDILIDFVDELTFNGDTFLDGEFKISPRFAGWDSRKLSIGAPPIKTEYGWLLIYHAIDDRDPNRYKIGAMILSLKDPRKVLYRTPHPILLPDRHYENEGKSGVAYPSGAVVLGDYLFVYYGGGDRVVCVATILLKDFLSYLTKCNSFSTTVKDTLSFDRVIGKSL